MRNGSRYQCECQSGNLLGMRQFSDWITIAIISAMLLFKFKEIQEPYFILSAALFGLMLN